MTHGLGWNPEQEHRWANEAAALFAPVCAASDRELPANVIPGADLRINNQGQRNSCNGNAIDKALERDHQIQTGRAIDLSARYSYLIALRMDGTTTDSGSSISGGAVGSNRYGTCLEEDFPYWADGERFDPHIPPEVEEVAIPHRVKSAAPLRSVDELVRFLGTGQGAATFGIWWTDSLAQYRPSDPDSVVRSVGGRTLGGHALACVGYRTMGGQKCPLVYNSHGTGWGLRGTMLVDPGLFDRWLQGSPFGAMGLSGLPTFTKRPLSQQFAEAV